MEGAPPRGQGSDLMEQVRAYSPLDGREVAGVSWRSRGGGRRKHPQVTDQPRLGEGCTEGFSALQVSGVRPGTQSTQSHLWPVDHTHA